MNGYSYDVNSPSFQDLWGYTPQAGQQAAAQAPTPAPAPNTPTEGGGIDFSNMSNIMPYYQQGQGMLNDAYNNYQQAIPGMMQQAQGSIQDYSPQTRQAYQQAQGQLPGFMDQAQQNINTAYTEAQNYLPQMYQGQVQPMMQQAVNQMAGRNMVNSSVGADALGNAMGMANQQILAQQGALGGQRAGLLSQLAGTGYQTRAGLAGQQAGDLSAGYRNMQNAQANLAGNMFNAQTGLMGQNLGYMNQLGNQYAQQASGLHGREYELLASMLPTLLNNSVPDGGGNAAANQGTGVINPNSTAYLQPDGTWAVG